MSKSAKFQFLAALSCSARIAGNTRLSTKLLSQATALVGDMMSDFGTETTLSTALGFVILSNAACTNSYHVARLYLQTALTLAMSNSHSVMASLTLQQYCRLMFTSLEPQGFITQVVMGLLSAQPALLQEASSADKGDGQGQEEPNPLSGLIYRCLQHILASRDRSAVSYIFPNSPLVPRLDHMSFIVSFKCILTHYSDVLWHIFCSDNLTPSQLVLPAESFIPSTLANLALERFREIMLNARGIDYVIVKILCSAICAVLHHSKGEVGQSALLARQTVFFGQSPRDREEALCAPSAAVLPSLILAAMVQLHYGLLEDLSKTLGAFEIFEKFGYTAAITAAASFRAMLSTNTSASSNLPTNILNSSPPAPALAQSSTLAFSMDSLLAGGAGVAEPSEPDFNSFWSNDDDILATLSAFWGT